MNQKKILILLLIFLLLPSVFADQQVFQRSSGTPATWGCISDGDIVNNAVLFAQSFDMNQTATCIDKVEIYVGSKTTTSGSLRGWIVPANIDFPTSLIGINDAYPSITYDGFLNGSKVNLTTSDCISLTANTEYALILNNTVHNGQYYEICLDREAYEYGGFSRKPSSGGAWTNFSGAINYDIQFALYNLSNGTVTPNLSIRAYDVYTGAALPNFSVQINGTHNFSTTDYVLNTDILMDQARLLRMNISSNSSGGYVSRQEVVTTSSSLNVYLYQAQLNISTLQSGTSSPISNFNVTLNGSLVTSSTGKITYNLSRGSYAGTITKADYNDYSFTITVSESTATNYSITQISTGLYQCNGSYTTPALTFFFEDEEDNRNLTTSFDVNFLTYNQFFQFANFSYALRGGSNYSLCINPSNANASFDMIASYTSDNYVVRNYYLNDIPFSSQLNNIGLYHLSVTNSSNVVINVLDELGNPLAGMYVKALRYYPSTNSFRLVEVGKTNSDGSALMHLIGFNAFYKFIVDDGTSVLLETSSSKVITTPITLYINTQDDPLRERNQIASITKSLTYNNNTGTFTFSWSDTSGVVAFSCLEVRKRMPSGDVGICNNCLSSSSGGLYCTLPNLNDTGTYNAQAYIDTGNPDSVNMLAEMFVQLGEIAVENFGGVGSFATFFVAGTAFFIGIFNPAVAIIMLMVSILFMVWMSFISFTWPSVILMVIVGVVLIARMRS